MDSQPKTLIEVKYQKAFAYYNQTEKEFFAAFRSDKGNWAGAHREMTRAWKDVEEIIQEAIKLKNKVKKQKS